MTTICVCNSFFQKLNLSLLKWFDFICDLRGWCHVIFFFFFLFLNLNFLAYFCCFLFLFFYKNKNINYWSMINFISIKFKKMLFAKMLEDWMCVSSVLFASVILIVESIICTRHGTQVPSLSVYLKDENPNYCHFKSKYNFIKKKVSVYLDHKQIV